MVDAKVFEEVQSISGKDEAQLKDENGIQLLYDHEDAFNKAQEIMNSIQASIQIIIRGQ